jgi:hypothetical protein
MIRVLLTLVLLSCSLFGILTAKIKKLKDAGDENCVQYFAADGGDIMCLPRSKPANCNDDAWDRLNNNISIFKCGMFFA